MLRRYPLEVLDLLEDMVHKDDILPGHVAREWLVDMIDSISEKLGVSGADFGSGREVDCTPQTLESAARQLGISVRTLRGMVGRAPPDLAGAPVNVGRRRRCLRWLPGTLPTWAAAFAQWDASERQSRTKPVSKPRRRRASPAGPAHTEAVDWNRVGKATASQKDE